MITIGLFKFIGDTFGNILAGATPTGLEGRIVARGPPVAHPWSMDYIRLHVTSRKNVIVYF